MNLLQESAIEILDQLEKLVGQIDRQHYTFPIQILSGASIGQHYRHTIELFQCLARAQSTVHVINYDLRERDALMESDPHVAQETLQKLKESFSKKNDDYALTLKANYSIKDDQPMSIQTSFSREMAYNIEHAIHHMALIKAGIKSLKLDIKISENFGVASSTVRFQKALQN